MLLWFCFTFLPLLLSLFLLSLLLLILFFPSLFPLFLSPHLLLLHIPLLRPMSLSLAAPPPSPPPPPPPPIRPLPHHPICLNFFLLFFASSSSFYTISFSYFISFRCYFIMTLKPWWCLALVGYFWLFLRSIMYHSSYFVVVSICCRAKMLLTRRRFSLLFVLPRCVVS